MSNGMKVFSMDLNPMINATPGFISTQFENLKKVGSYLIEDHELKHELSLVRLDLNGNKFGDEIVFDVQPMGSINTSTSSNIAVFNMPNGMPAIQAIGPNKTMMSWQGVFYDRTGEQNNQLDKAKMIEDWQNNCESIKMIFGPIVRDVVIQNYSYEYKRIDLIQYSISVVVDKNNDIKDWLNSQDVPIETLLGGPLSDMYKAYTNVTGKIASGAADLFTKSNNVKNNVTAITRQYGSLAYAPLVDVTNALIDVNSALNKGVDLQKQIKKNANFIRFDETLKGITL